MSLHPVSLSPSTNPLHRNAIRLLSMIHELHKAGFQRIRFSSGWSPSGLHWRCSVTHAGNMEPGGYLIRSPCPSDEVARNTSANRDRYFEWPDAPGRSARELASLFLRRCPAIARGGLGSDWAYAGWLTEVLGRAERDDPSGFPIFLADDMPAPDPACLPPPVPSASATAALTAGNRDDPGA